MDGVNISNGNQWQLVPGKANLIITQQARLIIMIMHKDFFFFLIIIINV